MIDGRYVPGLLFLGLLVLAGSALAWQAVQPSECGVDGPPRCPVSEHPLSVEIRNMGIDTDRVTVTLADRESGEVLHEETYEVSGSATGSDRVETGPLVDEAGGYTLGAAVADGGSTTIRWGVSAQVSTGGPRRLVTVHATDSVSIDVIAIP